MIKNINQSFHTNIVVKILSRSQKFENYEGTAFYLSEGEKIIGYTGYICLPRGHLLLFVNSKLYGIYIDEEERGKGLGRMLLEELLADLSVKGYEELRISGVIEKAKGFYDKVLTDMIKRNMIKDFNYKKEDLSQKIMFGKKEKDVAFFIFNYRVHLRR